MAYGRPQAASERATNSMAMIFMDGPRRINGCEKEGVSKGSVTLTYLL